jgi:hypothetical protein
MYYSWYNVETDSDVVCDIKIHKLNCSNEECNCPIVESVEQYKYLGIIIDKNMSWKSHVEYLSKKLRFAIILLRKLRSVSSLRLLKTVYYAFFQSRVQYGLVSYGNAFLTTLEPLVLLQKKAIRHVNKAMYLDNTMPLYLETGIMPLISLYYYRCICLYRKNPNLVQLETHHSARIAGYRLPFCRTTRGEHTFHYQIVKILNQLPNIITMVNLSEVKRYIRFSQIH